MENTIISLISRKAHEGIGSVTTPPQWAGNEVIII